MLGYRCVGFNGLLLLSVFLWIKELLCFFENDFRVDEGKSFFAFIPLAPSAALMFMADRNVSDACFPKEVYNFFVVDMSSSTIMITGGIAKTIYENNILNVCFFE